MNRILLRVYFSPTAWLGPGKIQLLEAIRDRGSISAAARAAGMSYRRAWLLVDAVNQLFGEPTVHTAMGGRGGGAARLTPLGLEIVRRYRRREAAPRRAIRADVAALERRIRPAAPAD
jgi:molybdate transport system regulatory protein